MSTLEFASETIRRLCCDPSVMRKTWGRTDSLAISRRLQQLEATTGPADLEFLPFVSVERAEGEWEIFVGSNIAIYLKYQTDQAEGVMPMAQIQIADVRLRTSAAVDS